jgi:hypothetical protein
MSFIVTKTKLKIKVGYILGFFFSFNNEIYFIDNQVIFININDEPDFFNN